MPVSISGNDTGGTANTDSIFIFSECLLGLFARIGERLFPNVTLNFLLLSETTFNSGKFYASYIDQIVNKLGKCCQVAQLDLERPGDLETDKLATFISSPVSNSGSDRMSSAITSSSAILRSLASAKILLAFA
jgi:hypothetical protein